MNLKRCHPWYWLHPAVPLTLIVLSFIPVIISGVSTQDLSNRRTEYDYYLASHGAYQYNCTILDIRGPIVSFVLAESFCVSMWTQTVPPDSHHSLQLGPSPCWTYEEYLCAPDSMSIVPNLEDTSDYLRRQRLNIAMLATGISGMCIGWITLFVSAAKWKTRPPNYEHV
jgi:hypothetical protein